MLPKVSRRTTDYPIGPFKLTKSAAKGVGSAAVKNTRMTSDAVSVFNGNFRQVSSSILGRIDYMPKSVVKKLAQEVNRTWLPTEISRFQGLPLGIETAATSVHLNLHNGAILFYATAAIIPFPFGAGFAPHWLGGAGGRCA